MESERSQELVRAVRPDISRNSEARQKAAEHVGQIVGVYEHIHGSNDATLVDALLEVVSARPNASLDEMAALIEAGSSLEDPDQISRLVFRVSDTLVGRMEPISSYQDTDQRAAKKSAQNGADLEASVGLISKANGFLSPVAARIHLEKAKKAIGSASLIQKKDSPRYYAMVFAADIELIERIEQADTSAIKSAATIAASTNELIAKGVKTRALTYVMDKIDSYEGDNVEKFKVLQKVLENFDENPMLLAEAFEKAASLVGGVKQAALELAETHKEGAGAYHQATQAELDDRLRELYGQKNRLSAELEDTGRGPFGNKRMMLSLEIASFGPVVGAIKKEKSQRKAEYKEGLKAVGSSLDSARNWAQELNTLTGERVVDLSITEEGQAYLAAMLHSSGSDTALNLKETLAETLTEGYVNLVEALVAKEPTRGWVSKDSLRVAYDFLKSQGIEINLKTQSKSTEII